MGGTKVPFTSFGRHTKSYYHKVIFASICKSTLHISKISVNNSYRLGNMNVVNWLRKNYLTEFRKSESGFT